MWFQFFIATGILLCLLVLPGFMFFNILGSNHRLSLLIAPAFSIALYNLLSIFYGFINVKCSALTIALLPTLILAIAFCANKNYHKPQLEANYKQIANINTDMKIAVLYLICGIVCSTYLFVLPLNGADSFVSSYDNLFHYNAIRSLLESGYWSPVNTSCYLDFPQNTNPMPGGTYPLNGYYPVGWHTLAALLMNFTNFSEAVVINVLNFTFTGILFPMGMYTFLSSVFTKKSIVISGALCSCICAIFPWHLLIEWPLFPNLSAFCLVPLLMACFVSFVGDISDNIIKRNEQRSSTACMFAGFIASTIACATIHPNSIFTAVVLLAPYTIWIIAWTVGNRFNILAGVLVFVLTCAAIVGIWIILSQAEAFSRVVNEVILARQTPSEARIALRQFSFTNQAGQPILFYLALIGIFYLAIYRRCFWLVFALAIAAIIYYISAAADEGSIKQVLTGFWYSEPKRTSCIVGIAAIPLISCGLAAIYETLVHILKKAKNERMQKNFNPVIGAILAAGLIFAIFAVPAKNCEDSALNTMAKDAAENYVTSVYSPQEEAFVRQVMAEIGSDEIVINLPYDGSLIAYGITGLKAYYLERYGYGDSFETPDSQIIRTALCDIGINTQVKEAVNRVGCKYLLILEDQNEVIYNFDTSQWLGISSINDETPGFTKVLESGSMRLFRIDTT